MKSEEAERCGLVSRLYDDRESMMNSALEVTIKLSSSYIIFIFIFSIIIIFIIFSCSSCITHNIHIHTYIHIHIHIQYVFQLAKNIASKSPVAVQGTKVNLVYSREHSVQEGLRNMITWNMAMLQSEDVMKSAMAAMDKSSDEPPSFENF